MSDYSLIAETLMESLRLRVAPVAVCLTDKPPQGVSGPSKPAAAGCVFWEWGARGALVTSPKDHSNCAVGMFTHHMPLATPSQQENLNDSLKVFADLGYVRPEDIPGIPVLKDEAKYVVYAPLASTPLPPSHANHSLPAAFDDIAARCLAKDPAHRYANAEALAQELFPLARHTPLPGPAAQAHANGNGNGLRDRAGRLMRSA